MYVIPRDGDLALLNVIRLSDQKSARRVDMTTRLTNAIQFFAWQYMFTHTYRVLEDIQITDIFGAVFPIQVPSILLVSLKRKYMCLLQS